MASVCLYALHGKTYRLVMFKYDFQLFVDKFVSLSELTNLFSEFGLFFKTEHLFDLNLLTLGTTDYHRVLQ